MRSTFSSKMKLPMMPQCRLWLSYGVTIKTVLIQDRLSHSAIVSAGKGHTMPHTPDLLANAMQRIMRNYLTIGCIGPNENRLSLSSHQLHFLASKRFLDLLGVSTFVIQIRALETAFHARKSFFCKKGFLTFVIQIAPLGWKYSGKS